MVTGLSVLPWSVAPRPPAARGGLCRRRTEHLAAVAGGGAHARHPGHRRAEPVAGLLRQRTGLPPGHGPPGGAPARHLYDQRDIPARTTQRQSTPGRCTAAGRAGPARPCRLPSSPVRSPRRWTKSSSVPPRPSLAARGTAVARVRPSPETAYRRCRSYGQWTGRRCLWTIRSQQQARVCRGPGGGAAHVPPSEGRWEACLRPHWTEVCAASATCRQTGAGARRSGRRAAGRRSR